MAESSAQQERERGCGDEITFHTIISSFMPLKGMLVKTHSWEINILALE